MITIIESNNKGVVGLGMTSEADIELLTKEYSKRGYATGSSAVLYCKDGNLRIFNYVSNDDEITGEWIEML